MPNQNPKIFLPGSGNAFVRRLDVVGLTPAEMRFFVNFHSIAQKYGLGLHCTECDGDIQGDNIGHEPVFKLKCKCREFKGERPSGA